VGVEFGERGDLCGWCEFLMMLDVKLYGSFSEGGQRVAYVAWYVDGAAHDQDFLHAQEGLWVFGGGEG